MKISGGFGVPTQKGDPTLVTHMVRKRYFKVPPPRTTIGCTGLLVKDTLVEIDLIGVSKPAS